MSDEDEDIRDMWDAQRDEEERRQWQAWLDEDPGYIMWLDSLAKDTSVCQ